MREIVRTGTGLCLLVVAGGLCLGGMVARAQTPAPPEFPSEVALITVDAVVVDAKGQPVTGLTREEFRVFEDGQPQEIVSFEAYERGEPGAADEEVRPPAVGRAGLLANPPHQRAGQLQA